MLWTAEINTWFIPSMVGAGRDTVVGRWLWRASYPHWLCDCRWN